MLMNTQLVRGHSCVWSTSPQLLLATLLYHIHNDQSVISVSSGRHQHSPLLVVEGTTTCIFHTKYFFEVDSNLWMPSVPYQIWCCQQLMPTEVSWKLHMLLFPHE